MTAPVSCLTALTLLLAGVASVAPARAEPCRAPGGRPVATRDCAAQPVRRIDREQIEGLRRGSGPGFVDMGGGTEIRVGGRVRTEFETRR